MLRQSAIGLLVTAALGCAAGPAVGGSETSETATKASLEVIRQTPLTIEGHGFRSGESVRVSAAARQWRPKTSARGSFVLALRGASYCRIVRIVAVGSDGSRAILRIVPARQCAPV